MYFHPAPVFNAPTVYTTTPPDLVPEIDLDHIATHVVDIGTAGLARGYSVWGSQFDTNRFYLSFDWQEIRQGVVLLMDPNGVYTNLCYVSDSGEEEPLLRQIVMRTRLLHLTPWQQVAVDLADQERRQCGIDRDHLEHIQRHPNKSVRSMRSAYLHAA